MIYGLRHVHWWPIIPGGALLAQAATAIATGTGYAARSGGIFLGGMGLTFALAFLLRLPRRDHWWALIPAAALALLAAPAGFPGAVVGAFAVALIGVGAWLLLRTRLQGEARLPVR